MTADGNTSVYINQKLTKYETRMKTIIKDSNVDMTTYVDKSD